MLNAPISPAEYNQARKALHRAMVAATASEPAICLAVADYASEQADHASKADRHGSVRAAWVAIAHNARKLARGNDSARPVAHSALESAKNIARKA